MRHSSRSTAREPISAWLRLLPPALFLLCLAGAAGVALTVIHLRQEVAHLASASVKLHTALIDTGQRLQEMSTLVAAAQEPAVLRARVGNRLAPMAQDHIWWVSNTGAGPRPATPVGVPAETPAFMFRTAAIEPTSRPGVLR